MPLTAALNGAVVDATGCSDASWQQLHRVRPRPLLHCRGCGEDVHAKVSSRGLRFFSHDRARPTCPSAGETPEHLELKKAIADLIRSAGWRGEVEAEPTPTDIGGWRADVLAFAGDGRRVAFEVQLASMSAANGEERTARYAADGIRTMWVTTKQPPWLWSIPGCRVERIEEAFVAVRGCLTRDGQRWKTVSVPLEHLVATFLDERVVPHRVGYLSEYVPWGVKERELWHNDALGLVSAQKAEADLRRKRLDEQAAKRRAQEEAERARNIEALSRRQEAALPAALNAAADRAQQEPPVGVWVGVPPTRLSHHWPRPTLREALGNEKTAMGAVIWLGRQRDNLRLFAVVCPVASRIGPSLAASWKFRGVRVFAAEEREARRIAKALGPNGATVELVGAG